MVCTWRTAATDMERDDSNSILRNRQLKGVFSEEFLKKSQKGFESAKKDERTLVDKTNANNNRNL